VWDDLGRDILEEFAAYAVAAREHPFPRGRNIGFRFFSLRAPRRVEFSCTVCGVRLSRVGAGGATFCGPPCARKHQNKMHAQARMQARTAARGQWLINPGKHCRFCGASLEALRRVALVCRARACRKKRDVEYSQAQRARRTQKGAV
jgi:hypothetical protein